MIGLKKFLLLVLVLLLIGAGVTAYYFYQQAKVLAPNRAPIGQEEVTSLMVAVGRLIVLPEGETPTIATVSNPEKLKDQAFFASAKAGDKVLIYTNAQKAFLYDPTSDRVINVAPLSVGSTNVATTSMKATTTNAHR